MVVTDLKCSLTRIRKERRARTDHDAVQLPDLILAFDGQIRILATLERSFRSLGLVASNCRICSLCQRRNGPLHLQRFSIIGDGVALLRGMVIGGRVWHVWILRFCWFCGGS